MDATKSQLKIANMKLQTENARQAAKIRNLQKQLDISIWLAARYSLAIKRLNDEAISLGPRGNTATIPAGFRGFETEKEEAKPCTKN